MPELITKYGWTFFLRAEWYAGIFDFPISSGYYRDGLEVGAPIPAGVMRRHDAQTTSIDLVFDKVSVLRMQVCRLPNWISK